MQGGACCKRIATLRERSGNNEGRLRPRFSSWCAAQLPACPPRPAARRSCVEDFVRAQPNKCCCRTGPQIFPESTIASAVRIHRWWVPDRRKRIYGGNSIAMKTAMCCTAHRTGHWQTCSESLKSPHCVSSGNLRCGVCSEWQQCWLRPQHRDQPRDVGFGPIAPFL